MLSLCHCEEKRETFVFVLFHTISDEIYYIFWTAILSHCSSLCHDTNQFLWKSILFRLIESNANPLNNRTPPPPKLLRLPSDSQSLHIAGDTCLWALAIFLFFHIRRLISWTKKKKGKFFLRAIRDVLNVKELSNQIQFNQKKKKNEM